ncbi:MAG: isochorismate synthase [Pseudomonadota bacterium]
MCTGARRYVTSQGVENLSRRVTEFFAREPDGPDLIVGAIPFDRHATFALQQPDAVHRASGGLPAGDPSPLPGWTLLSADATQDYGQAVAAAVKLIEGAAAGDLEKIVLARRIALSSESPVDINRIVRHLVRDRSIVAYAAPLPADTDGQSGYLVGATPELLVSRYGDRVRSNPLAGTARRSENRAADESAAQRLLNSEKDQREHRAVVEAVLDSLAPYCRELSVDQEAALTSTASLWHLGTQIEGRLKDTSIPSVELAAALHPTPAVCGQPRDAARAAIRRLEPFERGFYSGAVGWQASSGDGEWYVAIRCAEVTDRRLYLYAGAGIVAGSDPVQETEETAGKFIAMLAALGIDEQALKQVLSDTL